MPLPPALLARLKKRGIVNDSTKLARENHHEEEVIVENYSRRGNEDNDDSSSSDEEASHSAPRDPSKVPIKSVLKTSSSKSRPQTKRSVSPPRGPVPGCPNTSNPFHECSAYCKERWAAAKVTDSSSSAGSKVKKSVGFSEDTKESKEDNSFPKPEDEIEDKLPLPPYWIKVIDPASGYSYYWNRETDLVSWLHPLDEDAVVTIPASKLAQAAAAKRATEQAQKQSVGEDDRDREKEKASGDEDEDPRCVHCDRILNSEGLCPACNKPKQTKKPMKGGLRPPKRPRVDANEELDPMDPAAYDETVPRGTWSTGLVQQGAKAADSTASGPLFQQRPYPSPGDVLKANRGQKD